MVHIYSVSEHEKEFCQFLLKRLNTLISSENIHILEHDSFAVHISGRDKNNALILNGHLDTVPPGDEKMWSHNPFDIQIHQNIATGLGVSDMKSGLAVMMNLIEYYSKSTPDCDLWFAFVAGEETDGLGTRTFTKYFEKHYQSNYTHLNAIVLEPTNMEYIGIGHRGNAMYQIDIHGDTGHGSRPYEIKKHSIFDGVQIINYINQISDEWKKKYHDDLLGSPNITVTSINTGIGNSPNKFPALCTLGLDIRTTPKLHEELENEIKKIENIIQNSQVKPLGNFSQPAKCDSKQNILKALKKAKKYHFKPFPGATDLSFLAEAKIQGIVMGPGDPNTMHAPNERLQINNLEDCKSAIINLVTEFAKLAN